MTKHETALHAADVFKTYTNGVHALKGVSLTIPAGDFFALLGPNGAGKSTLVSAICGLIRIDRGNIALHYPEAGATNTDSKKC